MPFSLADYAKIQTDPKRKMVITNMLRESAIMELMQYENTDTLSTVQVRWNTLPSAAFRKLGATYTASEGSYDEVWESLYALGGLIEIDRVYEKVRNPIVDPRVDQVLQKTKSIMLTFNDYFINGDLAVDEDGFEGLKKRISNMPARQTVSASGSTDILDPTASAANARKFLDKWEEAAYAANDNDFQMIICNEKMMWGYGRVLRFLGASGGPLFDTATDFFEREVLTYKGARIVDIGLKKDQTTEIITLTEDPGDGGNDATSVYFVPVNLEDGVFGIQLAEPDIEEGYKDGLVLRQILVDWFVGLATFGSYGPTRLKNIETPANWT